MSMAMDADDEEVDAAASSVGALHMNPFRSNGGAGWARAPGLARPKLLAHSFQPSLGGAQGLGTDPERTCG